MNKLAGDDWVFGVDVLNRCTVLAEDTVLELGRQGVQDRVQRGGID
jgi:hypothetical protein